MCYICRMRIASRELRNDTAGVIRRAASGESVEITVNGEPVAELVPIRARRSHWTAKAVLLERLGQTQADPALQNELRKLSGDTDELGPIR
jgi:prevent-host-death family protein